MYILLNTLLKSILLLLTSIPSHSYLPPPRFPVVPRSPIVTKQRQDTNEFQQDFQKKIFNNSITKKMLSEAPQALITPKKLHDASRQLVKILRHKILEMGLSCDSRGFVSVNDLFNNSQTGMNRYRDMRIPEDLITIVDSNEKKRLELELREDGQYYIRAVQGHSANVGELLDSDSAFEPIVEPLEFCAHGTEQRFASSILAEGLKRMSRQHIHLVAEIHEDRQVSGYKKRSNAIVVIDMVKCLADGMQFLRAANGVILTEGFDGVIPPEYIKEIIER